MKREHVAFGGAREVSVQGTVTRADGTVEQLGVIAYWHANPFKRWAWRFKQLLRGRRPGRIQPPPEHP